MQRCQRTQDRNKKFHDAKMINDEVLESSKAKDKGTCSQTLYSFRFPGFDNDIELLMKPTRWSNGFIRHEKLTLPILIAISIPS